MTHKIWEKLFSPPCPNCGSYRTKEILREVPIMSSMKEFFDIIKERETHGSSRPIRTWICQECDTCFDEKGRKIIYLKNR